MSGVKLSKQPTNGLCQTRLGGLARHISLRSTIGRHGLCHGPRESLELDKMIYGLLNDKEGKAKLVDTEVPGEGMKEERKVDQVERWRKT